MNYLEIRKCFHNSKGSSLDVKLWAGFSSLSYLAQAILTMAKKQKTEYFRCGSGRNRHQRSWECSSWKGSRICRGPGQGTNRIKASFTDLLGLKWRTSIVLEWDNFLTFTDSDQYFDSAFASYIRFSGIFQPKVVCTQCKAVENRIDHCTTLSSRVFGNFMN